MSGLSLFKMGNVDYTRFITMPSYKVVSKPVTKEYKDVNEVTHAQYIRDQISGSFTLKFFDDSSYEDVNTHRTAAENFQNFFSEYQRLKQRSGKIEITVYVNNLNTIKTIQADMDMDPANYMPYMNAGKNYDGFDVTIKER